MPAVADEDLVADVDEPPDHRSAPEQHPTPFHKSTILNPNDRKESLLTKALLRSPEADAFKPDVHVAADLSRRRSMISNASIASTAELTSDGGLTSPARTNTPSPPLPNTQYPSFAPYTLNGKPMPPPTSTIAKVDTTQIAEPAIASASPKATAPIVEAPKRQRCISFACGNKNAVTKPAEQVSTVQEPTVPTPVVAPTLKRQCTLRFACPAKPPKEDKAAENETPKMPQTLKSVERRTASRSPSTTRKSPRSGPSPSSRSHRDSNSTVRRGSQSPVAARAKPKYIIADENTLQSSEATRFHEFASEEIQEDDWIRKDEEVPKARITINDTLKMENAIRRLGNEAEEEALEDEEDEDNEDEDDENDFDEEEDEIDEEFVDGSDEEDGSDGNETDNEAGFAESDDESDAGGDFAFWAPGRGISRRPDGEVNTYRASAHRTASASSIDSLSHMSPPRDSRESKKTRRPIKIRPGTPELPDSTDFVCGTLDEDRPLEDAYVSCMELRKNAKHQQRPQDIDPSFPTSDPENEEDENDIVETGHDSDEHIWLHGKFEEDDEPNGRRRSAVRRSPHLSPKRLHSPPPPRRLHSPLPTKHRLRSPPPRKLFGGHSPRRLRSPPPARTIRSPPASPTAHVTRGAINFAPLASRPGLTHTKSLPRTPSVFAKAYRAARVAAANCSTEDNSDNGDVHVREAIDIKMGLERKKHYRQEKLYRKKCNGKGRDKTERKCQPGKGAERMRELGLLIAGKTGAAHNQYMLSA